MSTTVVRKSIAIENIDILTVENLSKCKGLGSRGFSAALRMIIREWVELTNSKYQDGSQDKDQ